ncbi:hypothetical protein K439DRAFT_461639 [Ramaria rubella]|nr:hypothetical protein K439DRAFT_461639 [Ramaria rubella]
MNRHPTPLCLPNIRQPTSSPSCHLYPHLPCTLPALLSLTTASKLTSTKRMANGPKWTCLLPYPMNLIKYLVLLQSSAPVLSAPGEPSEGPENCRAIWGTTVSLLESSSLFRSLSWLQDKILYQLTWSHGYTRGRAAL